MLKMIRINNVKSIIFCLLTLVTVSNAQKTESPFMVDSLFDFSKPKTLGLQFAKNSETYSIFKPNINENKYNHGVVLFPHKGMLYAQWQSSSRDEDGEDTQVFYSRSSNGKEWDKPKPLSFVKPNQITTSGGWWSKGDTLVAYLNVWNTNKDNIKQGQTFYKTSTDGENWEHQKEVLDYNNKPIYGIIEQDIRSLPDGRLLTAFHMQPGLHVSPYFTDSSLGLKGWVKGKMNNLPSKNSLISRELEPSWFNQKDSSIVMVFRDQNSTYKKLASTSKDKGETWSTPMLINTPDSRAKQSAGNLPNGIAFMVNNPSGNKNRFPLVITLSSDGYLFDKAFLLRSGGEDLQLMKETSGKYKRIGYSYPKSVLWENYLYVAYATNKEDIELTRIPLTSLSE